MQGNFFRPQPPPKPGPLFLLALRMNNPKNLLPSRADQTIILLVDDEGMIRNVARIALEAEGYFILSAADGNEGLMLSRTFPGIIHLVVSDIKMPQVDGVTMCEQILRERPETKVLLMSGHVGNVVEYSFLLKPFTPAVLKKRVREMLAAQAEGSI